MNISSYFINRPRLAGVLSIFIFLIGLLIWALRTWKPEQKEKPALRMAPHVSDKEAY